ncbi:MAG TPA: hypothetical protein PKN29_02390, partial [Candidatus Ozemobacteraceae bacterium]|nr:hypothetical protein [Candidatus Ozemobacteraceae bacterium]
FFFFRVMAIEEFTGLMEKHAVLLRQRTGRVSEPDSVSLNLCHKKECPVINRTFLSNYDRQNG